MNELNANQGMRASDPDGAAEQVDRPGHSAWRPCPALTASAVVHATGAVACAADPAFWPWALGSVAANHALLGMAVMLPRSRLLGPNMVRLPRAARQRGEVCLTFDDGPDPKITPKVLDLLDRHCAKASFFCIGEKVCAHPQIVREIARRGHSVENHSHLHSNAFALYGLARLTKEVAFAQTSISGITGKPPAFFRAPAGFRSPLLDPVLARHNLAYVSWTRRGFDTVATQPSRVVRRLTRGLTAGDVLLLHDTRTIALECLPPLLERLAATGLKAVSLPAACKEGASV